MSRSPAEPGTLLRVRKVSQVLDVSIRHVYRLIAQGDLEAVRVGSRHIRVTRKSLDDLLQVLGRDFPAYTDDRDLRSHSPVWRERRRRRDST